MEQEFEQLDNWQQHPVAQLARQARENATTLSERLAQLETMLRSTFGRTEVEVFFELDPDMPHITSRLKWCKSRGDSDWALHVAFENDEKPKPLSACQLGVKTAAINALPDLFQLFKKQEQDRLERVRAALDALDLFEAQTGFNTKGEA